MEPFIPLKTAPSEKTEFSSITKIQMGPAGALVRKIAYNLSAFHKAATGDGRRKYADWISYDLAELCRMDMGHDEREKAMASISQLVWGIERTAWPAHIKMGALGQIARGLMGAGEEWEGVREKAEAALAGQNQFLSIHGKGTSAAYAFSPFIASYFDNFRALRVDYSFSYGGETLSIDASVKEENALTLKKARDNLEQIRQAVRASIEKFSAQTPAEILFIIDKTLFEDLGYVHAREDMELIGGLVTKRLDCDTAGMIYYEIGKMMGYPISLGIVYLDHSQHSIPIWGKGAGRTLWEAHTDAEDKAYANGDEMMQVMSDQGNPPISGLKEYRPSLILAINYTKFAHQTSFELQNRYGVTDATSESYLSLMRKAIGIDPDNIGAYVELGRESEAIEAARRLGGEGFAEQQRRKILEYQTGASQ